MPVFIVCTDRNRVTLLVRLAIGSRSTKEDPSVQRVVLVSRGFATTISYRLREVVCNADLLNVRRLQQRVLIGARESVTGERNIGKICVHFSRPPCLDHTLPSNETDTHACSSRRQSSGPLALRHPTTG